MLKTIEVKRKMEKGEPEITESKSLDSRDRKGFIEDFLKIKGVSEFKSPEGKFTKTTTKDIPNTTINER